MAFEGSVVLAIRLDKPIKSVDQVKFTAVSGAQKKSMSVPFQPGVSRAELTDLPEGDWHWWAELTPVEEKDPKYESPNTKDFTVNRGITKTVARALAGPYLLAFEVVSVLLLAALVGAAFLARKEVRE